MNEKNKKVEDTTEKTIIFSEDELNIINSFVKEASNIPCVECIYLLPMLNTATNKKIIKVITIYNDEAAYNELLIGNNIDRNNLIISSEKAKLNEIINSYNLNSGRLTFYDAWSGNYKLPLKGYVNISYELSLANGTILFDRFGEKGINRKEAYYELKAANLYNNDGILPIVPQVKNIEINKKTDKLNKNVQVNKNLRKFGNFVGPCNYRRTLEVAKVLGKPLPSDFKYEIIYRIFWDDVTEPFYLWQTKFEDQELIDSVWYYINIAPEGNEKLDHEDSLTDCISFTRRPNKKDKTKYDSFVEIDVDDGKYTYNWKKNSESRYEELTIVYNINEYEKKRCSFTYDKYSKSPLTIMSGYCDNKYLDVSKDDELEYTKEGYPPFINLMYDKLKKGKMPSYITEEIIDKIYLVFKSKIDDIIETMHEKAKRKIKK